MRVIGLDVGGANLKAADGLARSVSRPFPLWQREAQLEDELRRLLAEFGTFDHVAVTMTGELADCYSSKAEGVNHILDSIESATAVPIGVWQTGGEFVTPAEARDLTCLVAAANWHALATWAGRIVPDGVGLLVDIGSTTTDIIPLENGLPAMRGFSDLERLLSGELLYTGVRRTPVCAILSEVTLQGRSCPLAAELFATMDDVYLLLDVVSPDSHDIATADHRPRTRARARDRLARMICCDATEISEADLMNIAMELADVQHTRIGNCIDRALNGLDGCPTVVLVSGEGEVLARRLVAEHDRLRGCEIISLGHLLGAEHSQAACAFALARLGSERLR